MEDWVQKAIAKWKEEELNLNLKAAIIDIEKAETEIGFVFPQEFKQLYLSVNGFVACEWRTNFISLWSIEKIIDEYVESANFIGFADYCLSVFDIGFSKVDNGIFRNYPSIEGHIPEFIAASFKEIIEFINIDSEWLY